MKSQTLQIFSLLLILLCFSSTSFAQTEIEWVYNYGNSGSEIGLAVTETAGGGYIAVGAKDSESFSDEWWIIKLDDDGVIVWEKCIGSTRFDRAYDVKQTADGGYAIAGSFGDDGDIAEHNGITDFSLLKLDANGEIEWQKFHGTPFNNLVHSLSLTADGGYMLAGNSNGLAPGDNISKGLFIKLSPGGELEWMKEYGGSISEEIYSIQQTSDFGYVAAGCTNSVDGVLEGNNGGNDLWVIKMDQDGELEWSKTYGGSESEATRSIRQAADGGYIVAAYTASGDGDVSENYGGQDAWLVKLDENGDLEWERNYGGEKQDRALSVRNASTGGYLVGGWTRSSDQDVSNNSGLIDIWIFKIDDDGEIEWEQTFGGGGIDQCFDAKETFDGGIVATGNTNSSNGDFPLNNGSFDFWVMKLSPVFVNLNENNFDPSIVISPNPNSGQFTIQAPGLQGNLDITIYDMQGRVVYSNPTADINQVISVGEVSSGLYLLELRSSGRKFQSKILID